MSERAAGPEADERELDRLLAVVPPIAPPLGLREGVLRRVAERRVLWEWIVAALLAAPSLAFLTREIVGHGDEFARAFGNVVTTASSQTTDAFFFVDGLTIIALTLLGVACAVAAHAAGTRTRQRADR